MRWKTKDKTYGIQKPTQHFVRGIFTLFTSLCLTRPLSLNETFFIHWFVLSINHVLFFTCSFPLFDPHFKRSIHGLPYFHSFSFFSHSFTRPNLSPVRYTVFLWISTHALRSALRRISTCPQAPPQTPPPLTPSLPFISSAGRDTKKIAFFFHFIYNSSSFNCSGIRTGDQQAPPSIKGHPSSKRIPPAPPLAEILNNRLFEEILFGNFSLFHLHYGYHNVILLPLVTSVQNSLSATYKWNK